jgi:hypothetical protein
MGGSDGNGAIKRDIFGKRGIKMEKRGWLPDFRFGFVTAHS